MTPPEDWRRAMHARDKFQMPLRGVVYGLAITAGMLSLGLIGIGIGAAGWVACLTGGLGLVAAVVLWWEV